MTHSEGTLLLTVMVLPRDLPFYFVNQICKILSPLGAWCILPPWRGESFSMLFPCTLPEVWAYAYTPTKVGAKCSILNLWHLQFWLHLGLHYGGAMLNLNGDPETCLWHQKLHFSAPWHDPSLHPAVPGGGTIVPSALVPSPILGPVSFWVSGL